MRRWHFWGLTALLVFVFVGTVDATGRWKVSGDECYWDAGDSGPDQCSPVAGRWKVSGNDCYWDANDSGPDQCAPAQAPEEPPPGVPIPEYDESYQPTQTHYDAFGEDDQGPFPSCSSYTKYGMAGYIAIQRNPTTGHLAWGAYMYDVKQDFGVWNAIVTVNGTMYDSKTQFYPPHASISPVAATIGSIVHINVVHMFAEFRVAWQFKMASEWGFETWIPVPSFKVKSAVGNLTCLVTP